MPDAKEVYEMITKQKPPEPGALERQQKRQVRAARNKRNGAFAMAAVVVVAAIAMIMVIRPGQERTTPGNEPASFVPPSVATPADAVALKVSNDFVKAYGAFDAKRAMTRLADNADITGATYGLTGVEGLSLFFSLLQAQGYQQTITSCDVIVVTGPDTTVVCAFDFHLLRSDEIGRGPFTGSEFTFTVRDGEIVMASANLDIQKFSPQMWEPFAAWISATYPEDVTLMYTDGQTDFRLTEESVRLWDRHTREYVKEVQATQGQ